jgi:anti-sigma factor ChrR (cupin superfamily)
MAMPTMRWVGDGWQLNPVREREDSKKVELWMRRRCRILAHLLARHQST